MASVERPNRRALDEAIGIYRDAMRPFILRVLKRVRGSNVEEVIRRSLPPRQADTFNRNRQQGRDLASAIDVNMFRPLVQRNWNDFSHDLSDDRSVLDEMGLIATARDSTAHPEDKKDFDVEYTRVTLYHMAGVLGRINAADGKRDVESISAQLFPSASATASAKTPVVSRTAEQGGVRGGGVRFIAVDWSGAKDRADQTKRIWLAEAVNGELRRLECGRTRDEVVDILVKEIQSRNVVIGLDFAFSFPQWYLQHRKLQSARELWELARTEGEKWLSGDTWPFWGRPGPYQKRPKELIRSCQFRQTEEEVSSRKKGQPKSVFQVFGAGAVGTGTIRGLPFLVQLQDAGAAIWPFDPPKEATVVEIFPRSLTGKVVRNSAGDRADYLERGYPHLAPRWRRPMEASEDAFDAGVSALVMSAHAGDFAKLEQATGPPKSLEGEIWSPP